MQLHSFSDQTALTPPIQDSDCSLDTAAVSDFQPKSNCTNLDLTPRGRWMVSFKVSADSPARVTADWGSTIIAPNNTIGHWTRHIYYNKYCLAISTNIQNYVAFKIKKVYYYY